VVPSDRMRDNGQKLQHFCTVRVTKHSYRLPGEFVEVPSLEIFKSYLNMVLDNYV